MSKRHMLIAVAAALAIGVGLFWRQTGNGSPGAEQLIVQQGVARADTDQTEALLAPSLNTPREQRRVTASQDLGSSVQRGTNDSMVDSRERRRGFIEQSVEQTFGKAIRGLKFTAEEEGKLYSLLVERAEVAYDANEALTELRSTEPRDFGALIAWAQAEVETDMKAVFGAELFVEIKAMIDLAPYLRQVSQTYDARMSTEGVPLTPGQVLPLARVLARSYGVPDDPRVRPGADNVDPVTGLTEYDRTVLDDAMAILTPPQLGILRSAIAERNRAILRGS